MSSTSLNLEVVTGYWMRDSSTIQTDVALMPLSQITSATVEVYDLTVNLIN